MNRLQLGLALGVGYALGRRHRTDAGTTAPDGDPTLERLATEARAYLLARAQPLLAALGRRVGRLSVRVGAVARGDSPALARVALAVGRHVTRGANPPLPAAGHADVREHAPLELEEGSGP